MTVHDVTARPQKDIVLKIGTDEYQKQVSNVQLVPNVQTNQSVWQGGTPDAKLTDSTTTITWTLQVTAIQQLDDATSFLRWCLAHVGETAVVQWQPHADSDWTQQVTITIVPPTLGGPVNQRNESSLTFPVDGDPSEPTG